MLRQGQTPSKGASTQNKGSTSSAKSGQEAEKEAASISAQSYDEKTDQNWIRSAQKNGQGSSDQRQAIANKL